jgi:hypothetical protein
LRAVPKPFNIVGGTTEASVVDEVYEMEADLTPGGGAPCHHHLPLTPFTPTFVEVDVSKFSPTWPRRALVRQWLDVYTDMLLAERMAKIAAPEPLVLAVDWKGVDPFACRKG